MNLFAFHQIKRGKKILNIWLRIKNIISDAFLDKNGKTFRTKKVKEIIYIRWKFVAKH